MKKLKPQLFVITLALFAGIIPSFAQTDTTTVKPAVEPTVQPEAIPEVQPAVRPVATIEADTLEIIGPVVDSVISKIIKEAEIARDTLTVAVEPVPPIDTVVAAVPADTISILEQIADTTIAPEQPADTVVVEKIPVKDTISAKVLQQVDSLVEKGENYKNEYYFDLACDCFSQACTLCPDSLSLRDRLLSGNSCREMVSRVARPIVIARERFAVDEFMLYYPMADKSWHPVDGAPVFYSRDNADTVYVQKQSDNRIYCMECGDKMYFASKDRVGMGGYDLYVSYRNHTSGEWAEPVNMGFPYSSPYDDFLFYDTEDGAYSLFASNRECSEDSVYVYVLQRGDAPVEVKDRTPEDLRNIATLKPEAPAAAPKEATPQTKESDRLTEKINALQREKNDILQKLGKPEYQDQIIALRQRAKAIDAEIEDYMQEFLRLGLEFDYEELEEEPETQEGTTDGAFPFIRKTFGKKITVIYY